MKLAESTDLLLLAAGFGKRLRPLTETTPKPLIPFCGRPIIEWNLEIIAKARIKKIFINLHYLGEKIEEALGDGSKWGLKITYVKEDPILDTGGAIKNLETQLTKPFLITFNSDIIIDPSFGLEELFSQHTGDTDSPLATMLVRPQVETEESFTSIGVDSNGEICRFLDYVNSNKEVSSVNYTGIQVLSRRILDQMPKSGTVFSITSDILLKALKNGEVVKTKKYQGFWNDIGTIERLNQVQKEYLANFKFSK
jgi:NDP-sugar pyrophosphorylase family protein